MKGKFFVRLVGVAACVATFALAGEAEAGRWHRRHCCDPCCEPCCEPVCVTSCAPSCCAPACETVATYDCCGRLVYRRVACCETSVATTIVVPAASCCGIASTSVPAAGSVAKKPAPEATAIASSR